MITYAIAQAARETPKGNLFIAWRGYRGVVERTPVGWRARWSTGDGWEASNGWLDQEGSPREPLWGIACEYGCVQHRKPT